jgi:P4 family phage/plasmid primase-like protien
MTVTKKEVPDAAGDGAESVKPKAARNVAKKRKAKSEADARAAQIPSQPTDDESVRDEARRLLAAEQAQIEDADVRNPVLPSIRTNPLGCATILKERFFTKNGLPQVVYYRENWYCYYEELWASRTEDDMSQFVHNYLAECRTVDSEGELLDFVTSRENVYQVRFQLGSISGIPSHFTAPVRHLVKPKPKELNAKGKMVTLGQITDMVTGEQWSNQDVFVPNGAEWRFNAHAEEPKLWHKFLGQLFDDRDQDVLLLQEFMGYVLAGDTWAHKGLMIVGPKRAGKGIIGHVLKHLLGASMVTSPALKKIGENFGLENMVDKRMCLISDARLSNRQDTMPVIEMLLRIIANDPVDVTRKNKGALTLELGVRVMMLANSMPPLGDDSDAITSRFLILNLSESFFGREDMKLADKLEKELPGIALWAIEGYKRLIQRGKFDEPKSSQDARAEWYTEQNPVAEFLDDCCVVESGAMVEMRMLAVIYEIWRYSRHQNVMPNNVLSRKIAAILGPKIKRVAGDDGRRIEGLGLKLEEELKKALSLKPEEELKKLLDLSPEERENALRRKAEEEREKIVGF